MKICVSTASGIEAVTKRELYKITGLEDLPALNGRISFEGDLALLSKCNLLLRTANRVGIILGEFKASTFDEIFDGLKLIPFEDYIGKDGQIIVTAKCVQSKIFAVSATQSISKKAICERLKKVYGVSELSESGERYKIEISLLKDYVTVILDTSGDGRHRRGYRAIVGDAPLKETLASAMIMLSVWKAERPFADLFCGSGTLPIEATRIALDIPSGMDRTFDFLQWKCFDRKVFDDIKEDALSKIKWDKEVRICGYDIDEKQIRLAREHARLAKVDKYVHLQRGDMRDFSSHYAHGVIISNPPYGERLSNRKEIETLYRDYGKKVASLDDWCAYTLTSVDDFERLFGKKADKKRKIYNGKLECNFYSHLAPAPKKT